MTHPIVEEMSEQMQQSIPWRRGPGGVSQQRLALRTLGPGHALALAHQNYSDCKGGTNCSMRSALASQVRIDRPDVSFRFAHLQDGRLGVACFAKED
jgi:hypothetical protein